jgi:hypothetical protein
MRGARTSARGEIRSLARGATFEELHVDRRESVWKV